jgi:hypothetical protein
MARMARILARMIIANLPHLKHLKPRNNLTNIKWQGGKDDFTIFKDQNFRLKIFSNSSMSSLPSSNKPPNPKLILQIYKS